MPTSEPSEASTAPSPPVADLRNARVRKVAALRELGINPYPSRSGRTHSAQAILDDFAGHEGKPVTVAGRLLSLRKQGALTFAHLQDQTGRIQLFLRRDGMPPTDPVTGALGYADLNLLDIGDVVEATGTVIRTQRGEISVLPSAVRLLTKSLRPLPDKWAGLKDREAILRRRYLDTTFDPARKAPFAAVARMLYAIRGFLDERGFLEFQTPVIQPQYGGGTAKPFMTHVNALDVDMYLAISHELYLKRLIIAGFDRVYTIGRYFRNEGIDRTHSPEFSMLETMVAYENYEFNMQLIEDLFRHVGSSVFGRTRFTVRGHEVDFARPWARVMMADAVREATGIEFRDVTAVEAANRHLGELNLPPEPTIGDAMVSIFEDRVAPRLLAPTLVTGHPVEISPLAKPMAEDPRFAERFEIFIGGVECGDNWTEQNDPAQLLEFWQRGLRQAAETDAEFQPVDYDFLEALEHGMPPTTGIGPGIERMAMIFTGNENIDEVLFFPMMKPVLSAANRAIYHVREGGPGGGDTGEVVVTLEDLDALTAAGSLKPQTREILVRPRLRIWPAADGWRATGFLALEGFFIHKPLRVAGYSVSGEGRPHWDREAKRFHAGPGAQVADLLRVRFPGRHVTLSEVAQEGANAPGE